MRRALRIVSSWVEIRILGLGLVALLLGVWADVPLETLCAFVALVFAATLYELAKPGALEAM